MNRLLAATVGVIVALATAPPALAQDFAGLVDIGGDRSLYLNCQGSAVAGSPTVFVVPGMGSYAQAWNASIPPTDPVRAQPYDLVDEAAIDYPTDLAVQPIVARTTRICSYDRPDTRPPSTWIRSTPQRILSRPPHARNFLTSALMIVRTPAGGRAKPSQKMLLNIVTNWVNSMSCSSALP